MKLKLITPPVFSSLLLVIAFGFGPFGVAQAANQPLSFNPQQTAVPNEEDHTLLPTEGSGKEQVVYDQVNTSTASQKRAFGGEAYSAGRFERPFDDDMNYMPYLDIVKSTMQRGTPDFIYMKIQVAAPVSSAEENPALFGLQMDTNRDGRSEYLILAEKPASTEWTVAGVHVWKSSSAELALSPDKPAIPVTGSLGYDVSLFAAGVGDDSDLAWVRLVPGTEDTVEVAFKNTLVGGEKGSFVWRPMTDGATYPNTTYDLNVSYSIVQAGSPLIDSMFYPLKEVFAVDNTCRVASGYTPTGRESGLCPLPPPPDKPDKKEPGTPNIQEPPQ